MEDELNFDYQILYEKLIKEFNPIINAKAFKLGINLPPHLEVKDLVSAGLRGLMDAVGRYKAGKVKFKTYAEIRIHGAMIDMLRENAPIPRSMRLKLNRINKARDELRQDFGRDPNEEELAKHLKISIDELRKTLCIGLGGEAKERIADIEERLGLDGSHSGMLDCFTDDSQPTPLKITEDNESAKILSEAMAKVLNRKEKQVVFSYYQGGKTLAEIGRDLKITESRVCQIHAEALMKLKSELKSDDCEKNLRKG